MECMEIRSAKKLNEKKALIGKSCLASLPKGFFTLEFENINYSVVINRRKNESKHILKDLSGQINSGELVAVLGPSGSGKTTLMNVLAGCKLRNVRTGKIRVNGEERDLRRFRKYSCYIMQSDEFLPHLNVQETMMVSANLKLSEKTPHYVKENMVDEILEMLGLTDSKKAKISVLSGGQRKRLTIAQELVNNPPIMFFDEPTSGLDSQSSFQCIHLLKNLALGGRAIICTIHQPSAKLFEMFDKLYIIADGSCIYKGAVHGLLPYLKSFGLECPPYHNPADFVLEVACGEYGDYVSLLADGAKSGRCDRLDLAPSLGPTLDDTVTKEVPSEYSFEESPSTKVSSAPGSPKSQTLQIICTMKSSAPKNSSHRNRNGGTDVELGKYSMKRTHSFDHDVGTFPTSGLTQFTILFSRTFKCIVRDAMLTQIRILSHIIVGVLIGCMYYDIGNDATKIFNNSACLFFSMLFLMFTALMPTVMTFPMEMLVFVREHLNYWYSLKAYYFAKTLADLPFQILLPVFYSSIVYWLTSQPNDSTRFILFLLFSILVSLCAQSLGLLVGAGMSLELAIFLGPLTTIPVMLFSGFFVSFSAMPKYLLWLSYISYVRYAFEGVLLSVYGFERPLLNCEKNTTLCLTYRDASTFLEELDVDEGVLWADLVILLLFFISFRLLCYIVLRFRVWSQR